MTGLSRSTNSSLVKNGCERRSLKDVESLRARFDTTLLAHQQAVDQRD
jgi:hypothetical protein